VVLFDTDDDQDRDTELEPGRLEGGGRVSAFPRLLAVAVPLGDAASAGPRP
jgi:hypothetical protein